MQDSTTTPRGGVLAASARIAVTAASLAGVVAAVSSLTETDPPPGAAVAAFRLHDQTVSAAGPAEDVEAHEVLAEAAGRAHASVTARRAARERAARAARVAAAQRAEQARAAAAARAARNAARDPRSAARAIAADRGWGAGQFSCLDALWHKESGWKHRAANPSSGAYGIPQALPGGKMSSAGADWRTNPVTQIRWGLGYIADRYGTPCGAWAHSRAHNWY